jgi:hypothetical protein
MLLTPTSRLSSRMVGLEFSKGAPLNMGAVKLLSALLILFRQTFLVANVVCGFSIFWVAALQCSRPEHPGRQKCLFQAPERTSTVGKAKPDRPSHPDLARGIYFP